MACHDGTDDCNIPSITESVYQIVDSVDAAVEFLNTALPPGDTFLSLYKLGGPIPIVTETQTASKTVEVKESKTIYRKATKK
jgi:hypothetical protein